MERKQSQYGFSLVELLVAMTITLIVSGAIYGLLSSGQSAFRREPALVDRQQNVRIAMDLITRDVHTGGAGMTAFAQVFTDNLNDPGAGSVVSEIVPGERADFLEILANDGTCPSLAVCGAPGGTLFVAETLPACIFGDPPRPAFAFVSGTAGPAVSNSQNPGLLFINVPSSKAGGGCSGNTLNLPQGQAKDYNPGGTTACGGGSATKNTDTCQSISRVQLIRYEIAPEDPALALNMVSNPPGLWRSDYGRRDIDDNSTPNAGPYIGPNSPWQLVARGIDDMQIQYFVGAAWSNTPGAVTNGNFNTIVRDVRVTLSARTVGLRAGEAGDTTYAPGGTAARRGQLSTTVAPRAALMALNTGTTWR